MEINSWTKGRGDITRCVRCLIIVMESRSKCFFIGSTLSDNPVPQHFVALADELVQRGHRVVIIAPHRRIDLETRDGNPAIYTWPSARPTRPQDAFFLNALFKEYRPSCVIANFAAVNLMCLVGSFAAVPVRVAWYHTVTAQLEHDHDGGSFRTQLLTMRKRFVYQRATHLVANSWASAHDLIEAYSVPPLKCRVFHNALADPMPECGPDSAPTDGNRLVCVGRLFPSKGQDVLIRALAVLQASHPDAHVEFIGEGPAKDSYQNLAADLGISNRCKFLGHLEHSEVLRRMANAVATVVPSRSEAFGLVNIESLAVGTPVIASGVGGILEIVRDGMDGFLVPVDDPETLAAKVALLLSSPKLRHEMHCHARQRFLAHFEQKKAVLEQADWFESQVSSIQ
ncbi:MAG: hypothetical protein JWM68_4212 [Verrucomicrobiales bacterium]|nr:hypothetical protein [Verrucomicrobiales bacterium]